MIILLIIYLFLSRIFELIISTKNTKKLLKLGAVEYYPFHYKFLVIFHVIFLLYFLLQSFEILLVNYTYIYIFFVLQILRYKIIFDLRGYWTTRIIVLENKPLINSGVYRYLRHPNYLVVFFEVITVCLIFYDYKALIIFATINSILISIRIYFEEKANIKRRNNISFH